MADPSTSSAVAGRGETLIAAAVLGIVAILIVPVPAPVLDFLLALSVAISVYTVATADNKVEAATHEGAVFGAGIAGGIAGGALAGLACGPGAPVCVTLGAFVGGALAALGTDYFWQ